jgi:hypothetical protein
MYRMLQCENISIALHVINKWFNWRWPRVTGKTCQELQYMQNMYCVNDKQKSYFLSIYADYQIQWDNTLQNYYFSAIPPIPLPHFQSKKHWNCPSTLWHHIIWGWALFWRNILTPLQVACWRFKQYVPWSIDNHPPDFLMSPVRPQY